jgi:hypothetical protein
VAEPTPPAWFVCLTCSKRSDVPFDCEEGHDVWLTSILKQRLSAMGLHLLTQDEVDQPNVCWHCLDCLDPNKPRCERCPEECDDETCTAEGCMNTRRRAG